MSVTPLSHGELNEILIRVQEVRVAVLGDYCLDAYWTIDLSKSELSLETGKPTRPVRHQIYHLGGAGNVANNMVSLGCGEVYALGVMGNDPWGRELTRLLDQLEVDTADLLVQPDDCSTLVYAKPLVENGEQERLDFGNYNRLSQETAAALLERVGARLDRVDIVVINQQVREGIHETAFREGLLHLIRDNPEKIFMVDSRHYSEFYLGSWLKINDIEATRLCGGGRDAGDPILSEQAIESAKALYARGDRPVFVTRGGHGLVVCDQSGTREIPGVHMKGPVDAVGAGDSMLAGIALALAAQLDATAAAQFGNLVAAVTVQKIHQTGTATPTEIREIAHDNA
jgi:rfaE bifunctional protein kinase chain/domain